MFILTEAICIDQQNPISTFLHGLKMEILLLLGNKMDAFTLLMQIHNDHSFQKYV